MSVNRITDGKALATFGDELLVSDGTRILSYDESANGWTSKGPFVSTYVTKNPVIHDTNTQSHADCATHESGAQAYVWEQSGAVRYSIIDGATGQTVVYSAQLAATAVKPRVLVAGGLFVFYYYDTNATQLFVATLSALSPHATPIPVAITSVGSSDNGINTTNPNYDATVINTIGGQQIALAFNNSNGGTTVRTYGTQPVTTLSSQAVIAYVSRAITVFEACVENGNAQNNGPVVAFVDFLTSSTYCVRYYAYTAIPTLVLAGFGQTPTITTALAGTYDGIMVTGAKASDTAIGFQLYYSRRDDTGNGNVIESIVTQCVVNASYSVYSTDDIWLASVTLGAKAFQLNGSVFVPVMYDVNDTTSGRDQYGYWIVQNDKTIVAKALAQTAGNPPWKGFTATSRSLLPSVNILSGSAFRFAASEQANLNSVGLETPDGVAALTFDFDDPPHSFAHAQLSNNLHFSGGFVQMYDGVDVVEHNFHVYPEFWAGNIQLSSGGNLTPGKYSYCVTYEWTDHQNNIHRSRPSLVQQVTATSTDKTATLKIPYLQLTDKRADRPVEIVVYRTLVDRLIFYRASSLTQPTLNVIGGASLSATIVDTLSDAELELRPQLYTQFLAGTATGEPYEVENDPGPPTGLVQLHRNRIWVLDSTNPLQIWYSKEATAGAPVEFSNLFTKQVDPRGGPVTALATIDDKLLVFKQSHIFFIVGQGPTNTNQNNDLSDAILITTDVGCIEPRSVVGTPVGLMFQSRKGIYLIDRGLQVQYIGAPIEAYNDVEITSATLAADTNQVRFTLGNGKALVFDYFVQQWGVFTNHNAVDALIWRALFTYLRPNGQVLVETPGEFSDVGASYRLKLATSWLSFANVQGFQRVRRAQVLGGWKSPHNLRVDVCVDFNDTVIQSSTVQPQTPSIYGSTLPPYGSETPYGGEFQLYQWRVDLARQKTQSVKFIIQDLPTATAGEGMSLTSLGFEVGAKVGLNKVPATQIVG